MRIARLRCEHVPLRSFSSVVGACFRGCFYAIRSTHEQPYPLKGRVTFPRSALNCVYVHVIFLGQRLQQDAGNTG